MSGDGAGIGGGSSETRNMRSDNQELDISTRSLRDERHWSRRQKFRSAPPSPRPSHMIGGGSLIICHNIPQS